MPAAISPNAARRFRRSSWRLLSLNSFRRPQHGLRKLIVRLLKFLGDLAVLANDLAQFVDTARVVRPRRSGRCEVLRSCESLAHR